MAVLKSCATGNFTASGTWNLVDSTSYNNTETASTVLTTSYTTSNTFTPGAITVDGIMVKLSHRNGTTGTMSVALDQSGSTVAGTEVTINVADLQTTVSSDLSGGWIMFKFPSPVTLLVSTVYGVKAKTSSSTQVTLFSTATTNWARALVTTTTQAPTTGDDLIVAGEYTGAGTSNSFTVTMNETASTDYGAASTSLVTPALAVCAKGVLTWGASSATNYVLKLSGNLIVYNGGTYNQGTVGTPIPRNSTAELIFDCGTNVDFGLTVRNGGTLIAQGLSRTSGKDIYFCKLNTDEAINSTSLGVDTDTGWLDNDEIAVASTSRTFSECEAGALNGAAGASTLTIDGFAGASGGLAFAHSGTSPTQAEIILLTRNVIIRGASATLQSYVDIKNQATIDCDWTRFKWLGSATANKRGIDNAVTTGSCSFQYCALGPFSVASSYGYNQAASSGNSTFSNNVIWNTAAESIQINSTTLTTYTIDSNIIINSISGVVPARISAVVGTFSNNIIVGGGGVGAVVGQEAVIGTFSGNTWHSNGTIIQFTRIIGGTVSNTTIWRNGLLGGIQITGAIDGVLFDGLTLFGNITSNVQFVGGSNITINNMVSSGDSSFSTASGIIFSLSSSSATNLRVTNSTFGVASGIKTAHTQDINCTNMYTSAVFENCLFASPTEILSQSSMLSNSIISSSKHDQTAGDHKSWLRIGTIAIDTTIHNAASPSQRLTPNNASNKLQSAIFQVAVASGTTLTPSVTVRKSVAGDGTAYNGNQPRLFVKRNVALGIASDTLLATASGAAGSWETLSGTTATVGDDGVLEFYVDCDGTTGWINLDDWDCATTNDTMGEKFWKDGQPVTYGDNSAGGGGGSTANYYMAVL